MASLHRSGISKWLASFPPFAWAVRELRELLIGALRQGPVPQHVAFVMDGNRRFARERHIETVEGHNMGSEALARILEVCYKSGVKVVTIYAFSIENFKRSKHEVDALMAMAKLKLGQVSQHGALLDRYGASIRIIGQRDHLKPDVLAAIDKAVAMTAHNNKAILNVCFPYTSREEITTAVKSTVEQFSTPIDTLSTPSKRTFSESHITQHLRKQMLGEDQDATAGHEMSRSASPLSSKEAKSGESNHSSSTSTAMDPLEKGDTHASGPTFLDPETITAETLNSHMLTADAPPLDLLIRTSGVERLSDFMLWQCHQDTSIVFLECLWPEFDLWHFLPVMIEWQWQRKKLLEEQKNRGSSKND
ncbi:Undecaprenyl diphosphate synthase [Lentithecium fluviatile CBS 122367]|uniref:Alkyl transferase n=1 Tax=Lentithecium fluviatile CBS 122367 TaxID=1168545 RepID=A0A6G1JI11_9PLEO|nr:Undecaprenyl diphosphate synthase [Lentithecium fluviatile CBS 122367]